MSAVALALGVGAATGFCGAIPPGPAGIAVAARASEGRVRTALLVGIGAASVDVSLCAAIALGAGPLLARITEPAPVRVFLACAYAALGLMLLAETLLRRRPRKAATPAAGGFLSGLVRGITNPSLIANWTLVITGLTAAGAIPRGPWAGLAFALGVGAGVASWFGALAHIVHRARGDRLAPWLRAAGVVTGALLVIAGGIGAVRALGS